MTAQAGLQKADMHDQMPGTVKCGSDLLSPTQAAVRALPGCKGSCDPSSSIRTLRTASSDLHDSRLLGVVCLAAKAVATPPLPSAPCAQHPQACMLVMHKLCSGQKQI